MGRRVTLAHPVQRALTRYDSMHATMLKDALTRSASLSNFWHDALTAIISSSPLFAWICIILHVYVSCSNGSFHTKCIICFGLLRRLLTDCHSYNCISARMHHWLLKLVCCSQHMDKGAAKSAQLVISLEGLNKLLYALWRSNLSMKFFAELSQRRYESDMLSWVSCLRRILYRSNWTNESNGQQFCMPGGYCEQ